MRIGIDARTVFRPVLKGIGVYLFNLIQQLALMDQKNEYVLYYDTREETFRRTAFMIPPGTRNFREKGIRIAKGETLYFWEQFRLPWELKRDRIELLHSPANTTCAGFSGPKVVTVHDTTLQKRKGKGAVDSVYHDWLQPRLLRKAARVITVSEYSKRDIVEILKVPEAKITVIAQGLDPAFSRVKDKTLLGLVKEKYGIPGNYIFNAGGESDFKNVTRLLEAYGILVRAHRIPEDLVITGIRNPKILEVHLAHAGRLGLLGRVHILGFIPLADLIALYSGARLFIYPSLMEGFGFPPLEAMACGTPAIVSDAASIPEVAGDAALPFDPRDPEDIARKAYLVLSDESLQEGLVAAGYRRIKRYRWDDTAAETLKVYEHRER